MRKRYLVLSYIHVLYISMHVYQYSGPDTRCLGAAGTGFYDSQFLLMRPIWTESLTGFLNTVEHPITPPLLLPFILPKYVTLRPLLFLLLLSVHAPITRPRITGKQVVHDLSRHSAKTKLTDSTADSYRQRARLKIGSFCLQRSFCS